MTIREIPTIAAGIAEGSRPWCDLLIVGPIGCLASSLPATVLGARRSR
jgi:hypothetical protein